MNGWIKLHRKILNNPICVKDADHLSVWVYLLLSATHDEMDMIFKNKRITLKPGQLITGRKVISRMFKINEHKVDRILKALKSEQQIEQQTSSQNRLITIINWNQYQQIEQQIKQRVSNERATSEQRVSTNKNVKKERNINKHEINQKDIEYIFSKKEELQKKSITSDEVKRFIENMKAKGTKYKDFYLTLLTYHRNQWIK